MPVKIARSTPRPSFGLPELLVASHISRLASRDAAKSLLSTLVSESSGECRLNCHVVANRNLPSWPWPAFLPVFFLSKPIRGSLASMGLADSSRRIRIADIELAYRITGRGKPVILVHGLACGQRMWFHQRRKLSDRHTVITYDQ